MYIFYIVIVILVILIITIYYNLKKKESFSNYSQYSKQKILHNCADGWAKIYPQTDSETACETQAWVTNPKYLCGICGDTEKNPLYSFQPNNDMSLPRLFGCSPSAPNRLGLSWQQGSTVNPLNLILSDKLSCDFQNINASGDMYMYIYADDYCYVSLNGTQIISKSGWNSIGVYYLQNIKYGDEFSCELVNVCAPGGINVCYIWNKQLFIMDENGFENCANIIKYKATGTTGWSNEWIDDVTDPLPWMTNWLTCPYVNCSGQQSSATITFNVGDYANQKTLNNDLVGFVGVDDSGSVYYNNTVVFTKPAPWSNVLQFTISNVSFMDSLEVKCTNTGGPGAVCLSYLWCGQLFTIPNNLENFDKVSNIITYTGSNINTLTYPTNGTTGNLQFVTNWINSCYGACTFSLSAFVGYNPWSYGPSSGQWYTIVQNNNVGTWSDLPLMSNSQMTISFWVNISTINANWRNIFHFSNNNVNCCNVGNRVPALWVWPSSSNLYLVNDLQDAGNQNYINPSGFSLNTPVFIALTWSGVSVNSYVNGVLQQSATYPTNIEPVNSNTIFYIGDPWYTVDGGVQICNFEISNSALSASYISEIYNQQNSSLPQVPVQYNPWIYGPTNNEWYTIVQNNYVNTWSELPLTSNSQMTVSFWVNLSTTNANWRNIFHFSNNNVNCCNVGNRVPALWVWPSSLNLYLINDLQDEGNQNYINPSGISLNTPVFITIVWSGTTVTSYINGAVQQTATYPTAIEPANSSAILYIGDPWYTADGGVKICNFEIFNLALSADYISQTYNQQKSSLPAVP